MVVNEKDIVPLLLCKISNVLPEDPVVSDQGEICDKKEFMRSRSVNETFYPCKELRYIIDILLATGEVEDKYIGAWARKVSSEKCTNNDEAAHEPNRVIGDVGIKDIDSKREHERILQIKTGAEGGDCDSMVKLGELYLAGTGVLEKDEKKGYTWFERAADNGYDLGVARKADCLMRGIGIDRDFGEAYEELSECRDSGEGTRKYRYYSQPQYNHYHNLLFSPLLFKAMVLSQQRQK